MAKNMAGTKSIVAPIINYKLKRLKMLLALKN